jgi:hypothetical protein
MAPAFSCLNLLNLRHPSRSRPARRLFASAFAALLTILLITAMADGGLPWGIDFSKPAEGPDRFSDSVRTIVWWSVFFDLLVVALLWWQLPRWIGTDPAPSSLPGGGRQRLPGAILGSALLAAGALTLIDAPRLSESLWNDEIWSLRESIHGSWDRDLGSKDPDAVLLEIYWEPIDWELAIWRYETTNHHFLLNLMAKAGLGGWQWVTGAEDWEFDEVALRILPFLCALGGLVAWATFFGRLGYTGAALILPWLLALHPWYQQHATGMRGYPLVFLFLPLALLQALAAVRHGRWGSWLGFAAGQFLFLYSWPAGALVMLPFNACLAVTVWRRWGAPWERRDQLRRWAVANLVTLMVLLPLVVPGFFQIGPYLEEEVLRHPMGLPWLRNLASFLFTGAPWPDVDGYSVRSGFHVTGEMLARSHRMLFATAAAGAITALAGGVVVIVRRDPRIASLLLIGLSLGPALCYLKATLGTVGEPVFIFQWYLVYALPFLCGVACVGISAGASLCAACASRWARSGWARPVALASAIGCLAGYGYLIHPRTVALRQASMEPRRESVRAMRGDLSLTDPANAGILTAHIFRTALVYDPLGWLVETASNDGLPPGSPPGLTQLMRIADSRDLTLFVNVGLPSEARQKHPEAMGLIDDSGFFDLHSQHFGLEPQFERSVYRYRGGLFKFDFSRPKP